MHDIGETKYMKYMIVSGKAIEELYYNIYYNANSELDIPKQNFLKI